MSHTLPTPPDSAPSSPQESKPKVGNLVATASSIIDSRDDKASSPISEQSDSTDEESFTTISRSNTTPSLIPDEDDDVPRFDDVPYPIVTPTGSPTLPSSPTSPGKSTSSLPKVSTPHPYRPSTPASNPRGRSRLSGLGISPLTQVNPHIHHHPHPQSGLLPKSQPLSRALFNRNTSDSHAGIPGKKKIGQKLIVPNKAFKTTFELQLTSSEFARKAY